jgi:hypothetical protein
MDNYNRLDDEQPLLSNSDASKMGNSPDGPDSIKTAENYDSKSGSLGLLTDMDFPTAPKKRNFTP